MRFGQLGDPEPVEAPLGRMLDFCRFKGRTAGGALGSSLGGFCAGCGSYLKAGGRILSLPVLSLRAV